MGFKGAALKYEIGEEVPHEYFGMCTVMGYGHWPTHSGDSVHGKEPYYLVVDQHGRSHEVGECHITYFIHQKAENAAA